MAPLVSRSSVPGSGVGDGAWAVTNGTPLGCTVRVVGPPTAVAAPPTRAAAGGSTPRLAAGAGNVMSPTVGVVGAVRDGAVTTGAAGDGLPCAGGAGAAGGFDGGVGGPTWTDGPVAWIVEACDVDFDADDIRLTFALMKMLPYEPGPPLNGEPSCSHDMICAPRPAGSHAAPSGIELCSDFATADPLPSWSAYCVCVDGVTGRVAAWAAPLSHIKVEPTVSN